MAMGDLCGWTRKPGGMLGGILRHHVGGQQSRESGARRAHEKVASPRLSGHVRNACKRRAWRLRFLQILELGARGGLAARRELADADRLHQVIGRAHLEVTRFACFVDLVRKHDDWSIRR